MNNESTTIAESDVDAIDAIGRRAGAELRHGAPADGFQDAIRRAKQRTTMRMVAAGGAAVALVIGGFLIVSKARDDTPVTPAALSTVKLGAILYQSGDDAAGPRELWTADADGRNARVVQPAWEGFDLSPDQTTLQSTRNTSAGLVRPYLEDLGGGNPRFIEFSDPQLEMGGGVWSPDGSLIVAEGTNRTEVAKTGLYSFAADGSKLTQLTSQTTETDTPAGEQTFSPDGTKILYYHTTLGVGNFDELDVMMMNVDGTDVHRLNPAGFHVAPDSAVWSPDSKQVAFVGYDTAGNWWNDKTRAVFVTGRDGVEGKRVTELRDIYWDLAWSPDGTTIALTVWAHRGSNGVTGDYDVFTMRPDGSELKPLVQAQTGYFTAGPRWSPDGRSMLFTKNGPDGKSINVMDLSSGATTQILPPTKDGYFVRWVPKS